MPKTRILPRPSIPGDLDSRGKRAFERIVAEGADATKLSRLIGTLIMGASLPKNSIPLAVAGMTSKKLRQLPAQIRDLACSIENVNNNPHLQDSDDPGGPGWGSPSKVAEQLPGMLKSYALKLEGQICSISRFLQVNPAFFDLTIVFKRKVLRYVEQATGKPRFSLVAELLNSAFLAADLDNDTDAAALRYLHIHPELLNRP